MVSVSARRSAVAYATGRGLSQRRACTLLKVARSALGYRPRKAEKDARALGADGRTRATVSALRRTHPGKAALCGGEV
jgi:hypothetical protein